MKLRTLLTLGLVATALVPAPEVSAQQSTSLPLQQDRDPFRFQRLGIVLDEHAMLTNQPDIRITGRAFVDAVSVEICAPTGVFQVPVTNNKFRATIPLDENRVNQIFFVALAANGDRGTSVTTFVTMDNQPPAVFIDFPTPLAQITTNVTDVAGRVGDALSGFESLTVDINGIPAVVDVGIGTNGTFFVQDIPLLPDQRNLLQATATDALGNSATSEIYVQQIAVGPGVPSMSVQSGNGQIGMVGTELAQQIVVEVLDGNQQPFANKIVTFDITRSDGGLSETSGGTTTQSLQVRTDSSGLARAFWTLGSDAGCGNNRVEATSTNIAGTVFFCASGAPGPAGQISIGMGNNQMAQTGGELAEPLRVWVHDARNPVPGVPVIFQVIEGGGSIEGQTIFTAVTDVTGHANATLTLGPNPGLNRVQATFAGNPTAPAVYVANGIESDPDARTVFRGIVLNNSREPLEHAHVELEIAGVGMFETHSDIEGEFVFDDLPAGGVGDLHVDGATVTFEGGPGGTAVAPNSFPALHFEPVIIIEGAESSLPIPVLLPPLDPLNSRTFDATEDVVLTIRTRDDMGAPVEIFEGLEFTVAANTTVTLPDGTRVGPNDPGSITLQLNQVHIDDIPMPMPDGAAPPFAWTLKPTGAQFDPPIQLTMPNMSGRLPGEVMYFLSFDHDTNRFEIVATGAVSADGSQLISDPGSGIVRAGWGGFCPPYPMTGTVDGEGDDDDDQPIEEDEEKPENPPAAPDPERIKRDCPKDEQLDPVYLFSGEFYEECEDLRIKGRGMDFVWARKYRSKTFPMTTQGNGWDCSYNIFVQAQGSDILLCDGNSRADTYVLQPSGNWVKQGYFRELMQNPDTSYTLVFEDRGVWNFRPLDGSPSAGRIDEIVDRNGNSISFAYDGLGRLQTVTDTLNRDIQVAYNADGFVQSVTDFIGRQVRYEYYQDPEPGGSFGDLKTVRTPTVTGTSTGNDFPSGKTTTYTYSEGFADPRLNGNLLTIRDPRGALYLQNVYSTTTNPNDLEYDRIVRQVWGDAGDIIDVVYVAQTPTTANQMAIVKAIVNDRVGNVGEFFFDDRNVGVMERLYTGRADPDMPTSDSVNRPTGRLRASDPVFYERRQVWNRDRRLTSVIEPDGSQVVYIYEDDLNKNADPRAKGNLRVRVEVRGAAGAAADQQSISEVLEYDPAFGSGCCGAQFVSRVVDGRGNVTFHDYDSVGNRIMTVEREPSIRTDMTYNQFGQITSKTHPANDSGFRRMDTYSYYQAGPQRGYLESIVMDAGGANLTTTFEHDAVGNITRIIDPRGRDVVLEVNELDQVVRRIEREVDPSQAQRYEVDMFYDANDNIVRVDVLNVDETGAVVSGNDYLTTLIEYETLNHPVRVCDEAGAFDVPRSPLQLDCSGLPDSEFITVAHQYDENRNRTRTDFGEAAEGRDPFNAVAVEYDERDLIYRVIRGPGSPVQSTTQYDYDENANTTRIARGLEDTPRVAFGEYDYYDRLVKATDPMGNTTTFSYDGNGNLVGTRRDGQLIDVPGGALNDRLGETAYEYDRVDRMTRKVNAFFETATGDPIQGGQALGFSETRFEYTDSSQLRRRVNDNGNEIVATYDTMYRVESITDANGSSETRAYDENSNLVAVTEIEISDLPGAPNESFTTTYTYDGLDRLTSLTDAVGDTAPGAMGNTRTLEYDARDNLIRHVDALGNVIVQEFDGVDRLLATRRVLTADGTGATAPVDEIVDRVTWDDSYRIRSRIDSAPGGGAGNEIRFAYDALNRPIVTQLPDGRLSMVGSGASWPLGAPQPNLVSFTSGYDPHDNATLRRDPNGTVISTTFDLRDRRASVGITPGAGVSTDTTFETYAYDGRSRLVRGEDDDSIVTWSHDSLSNVLEETLNGVTTTREYDGVRNTTRSVYPGGRSISSTYDALDRIATITDTTGTPSSVATYEYVGWSRPARRTFGNGTQLTYAYDGIAGVANPAGDFGDRQIVETHHVFDPGGANTTIDRRRYAWDRAGNKTRRIDVTPGGALLDWDFQYDSVYRLVNSRATDPGGPTIVKNVQYAFDNVGNRSTVTGGTRPGAYALDATLPDPGDRQLNQYTTTSFDVREYDDNGNLTHHAPASIAQPNVEFDFRNRMTEYVDTASGERSTYQYDVLGRRIARTTDADGSPTETRYFYESFRVCEERSGAGQTEATYVYGRYLDEVLQMQRGGSTYYYHQDDVYSVMALTDVAGTLVERYEYDDYGEPVDPSTLAPLGGSPSGVENPYLFQGRRYDPETEWYYFRTRYLDPIAGRFVSRDLIGTWGERRNNGNAFSFAGNNPTSRIDPFGTDSLGSSLSGFHSAGRSVNDTANGSRPAESGLAGARAGVQTVGALNDMVGAADNATAASQNGRAFREMNKSFDPKTGKFNGSRAMDNALQQRDNARGRAANSGKLGKGLGAVDNALSMAQAAERQFAINEESDKRRSGVRSGYHRTLDMLEKMRKKYLCRRAKGHITQDELEKKLEWIRRTQEDAQKEYEEGEENAEYIQVLETLNNLGESITDVSGAGDLVKTGRDILKGLFGGK